MAYDSENKSSAELQRELEQQRNRVENTIDEIQQKLSPGQMVDELLAYTKGGGGEFVSSLQRNITANPLPVALLGVSLAWLMAKPVATGGNPPIDRQGGGDVYDDTDYPIATISGSSLQRVGQVGEGRERYSEFIDDAGKKFRARSDTLGKRAGHFTDEAGNRFKGFSDAAGQRIGQIRDEAGNLLDDASGWASHTWQMARETMHDVRDAVSAGRSHMGAASTSALGQMGSLNETMLHQLRDQPLVGGALAFALGAALGAALPHTEQEDAAIGEVADTVKAKAAEQAADIYGQGKEKVVSMHEAVSEKAGDLYQQVKDGAGQATGDRQS